MSDPCTPALVQTCNKQLQKAYTDLYGCFESESIDKICSVADIVLAKIASTDAPYHDLEHSILVTLTGLEILRGKHLSEGNVSRKDWLNTIVSLLCHDIGYRKGICRADRIQQQRYAIASSQETIYLSPKTTDASLAPYHVDRGKLFVAENFSHCNWLDIDTVQDNIELTRFPVPQAAKYQDTVNYPGLVRAADLIGQLADPDYLVKMTRLFREFEEIGTHQYLGYRNPQDLRRAYPNFFHNVVFSYIQDALHYLNCTYHGQRIIKALYQNVTTVENEGVEQQESKFTIENSQLRMPSTGDWPTGIAPNVSRSNN
jgi:hypothetical protein